MPVRAALSPDAASAAPPVPGDAALAVRSEGAVPPTGGTAPSGTSVASAMPPVADLMAAAEGALAAEGRGVDWIFAHVEYGMNPTPIYPDEARRRAEHGTVVLRIHVTADGSVEGVEVARSSGFDLLDDSAIETVRTRWRFIAARRDGVAVESWCEVPIRFALTEAQAN